MKFLFFRRFTHQDSKLPSQEAAELSAAATTASAPITAPKQNPEELIARIKANYWKFLDAAGADGESLFGSSSQPAGDAMQADQPRSFGASGG